MRRLVLMVVLAASLVALTLMIGAPVGVAAPSAFRLSDHHVSLQTTTGNAAFTNESVTNTSSSTILIDYELTGDAAWSLSGGSCDGGGYNLSIPAGVTCTIQLQLYSSLTGRFTGTLTVWEQAHPDTTSKRAGLAGKVT